jgi:hypothetical protein
MKYYVGIIDHVIPSILKKQSELVMLTQEDIEEHNEDKDYEDEDKQVCVIVPFIIGQTQQYVNEHYT